MGRSSPYQSFMMRNRPTAISMPPKSISRFLQRSRNKFRPQCKFISSAVQIQPNYKSPEMAVPTAVSGSRRKKPRSRSVHPRARPFFCDHLPVKHDVPRVFRWDFFGSIALDKFFEQIADSLQPIAAGQGIGTAAVDGLVARKFSGEKPCIAIKHLDQRVVVRLVLIHLFLLDNLAQAVHRSCIDIDAVEGPHLLAHGIEDDGAVLHRCHTAKVFKTSHRTASPVLQAQKFALWHLRLCPAGSHQPHEAADTGAQ